MSWREVQINQVSLSYLELEAREIHLEEAMELGLEVLVSPLNHNQQISLPKWEQDTHQVHQVVNIHQLN